MIVNLQKSRILKHLLLQIPIHIIVTKTIKRMFSLILKVDKITMMILITKENQGIKRNLMTELVETQINKMMIQIKSKVANIETKTIINIMIVKDGKMIIKGTMGKETVVVGITIIISIIIKVIKIITIIKIIIE